MSLLGLDKVGYTSLRKNALIPLLVVPPLRIMQTFISEKLNHSGAPQPTPNSIRGALFIRLLVCSCSCDFDAGNFQLSSLLSS